MAKQQRGEEEASTERARKKREHDYTPGEERFKERSKRRKEEMMGEMADKSLFSKALSHKYRRRTGISGKYQYVYGEPKGVREPHGDYGVKTHSESEYKRYLDSLTDDEKELALEQWKLRLGLELMEPDEEGGHHV